VLTVFILIVALLLVDAMISNIADFIANQLVSSWGVALFIFISSVYVLGQYFILGFIKAKSNTIRNKVPHLKLLHLIVTIFQYTLTAILIFVTLQIVLTAHYYTIMLTAATAISYILASIITGLLAARFFSWYKLNKNRIVFLYGLSSIALAVMAISAISLMDYILIGKHSEVNSQSEVVYPSFKEGSLEKILSDLYAIPTIVSFVLVWGSTVFLLRNYSQRLGRVKYLIIIGIPLVTFASQYFDLIPGLGIFDDFTEIVLTTLHSTAGGFLFAIVFITAARQVHHSTIVKEYLFICAYGFVLLFTAFQGSVIGASYPPFGLTTVSFVGIGSYLIFIGLYSSAISLSQDANLRQSIRESALEQSKLLDNIGMAHMEQELEKIVAIAKEKADKISHETGVESSLSQQDIKQYIEEVLIDAKTKKSSDNKYI
jgi:hypothetical protein